MDPKRFIEGLTGMSLKEYLHVLINDWQEECARREKEQKLESGRKESTDNK